MSEKPHNRQKGPCEAHREHYPMNLGQPPVRAKKTPVSRSESSFQKVLENYTLKALYGAQRIDYRQSDCMLFIQNWLLEIGHPVGKSFSAFRDKYRHIGWKALAVELDRVGCCVEGKFSYSRTNKVIGLHLPHSDHPEVGDVLLIECKLPALAIYAGDNMMFSLSRNGEPLLHTAQHHSVRGSFSIRAWNYN